MSKYYFKRRVTSTEEMVEVTKLSGAIFATKDGRKFREEQLDTFNTTEIKVENAQKSIPYFIMDELDDLLKNYIPPHVLITMLPTGRDTPMYLGTYISPMSNDEWTIRINDQWGDRSQNEVIRHSTVKGITTWENVIYYSIRDVFKFINARYPGDPYIIKTLKTIRSFIPNYFENKEFFKREYKEIYEEELVHGK